MGNVDTSSSPVSDTVIASVREWVAGWSAEVAAADIRAGRERFAGDLVAFGTHADVVAGRDEVEAEQWSQIWPRIEEFAFLVDELVVQASPDGLLAVAIVPWTSVGIGADGTPFDRPGRATIVLARDSHGAAWVGTHTHFSLARGVPQSTHGERTAIR
ncbi:MAG TPA: nuclear transport factor 2 family protein [Ilumatobacter sp.]|nr:nuclear transport factor 2 family protein [Ilumatobacter sp.]